MSLKEIIICFEISIKWAQVIDRIFHPKKKKKNPILWKINTNTNINTT